MPKPHAAARRVVAVISSRPLTEPGWEDVIQREYQPLVDAAQEMCDQWGKGNVHNRVVALREAIRSVLGEEGR